ncbi:response regulator [Marinobacter sp. C2H3]|uniref:response regulator n=1 Tax=Marinobacter sp. C2H3 TaxID=3119003 RepID=UPI00300F1C15
MRPESARPYRVLCVEDDADIRAIAELALADIGGFETRLCASGDDGLKEAVDFAPDLVILDVMMPGMDGPETLRALRQLPDLGPVPVVFMTARLQDSEVADYLAQGVIGVIPKPFDPLTLAEELRALMASAMAQQ